MRSFTTISISPGTSVEECNNAAYSADETADILLLADDVFMHEGCLEHMQDCLYAAEKHGIACGQEIGTALIETAEKYLPAYSRIVRPATCCTLVKRAVVNAHGFLDAAYNSPEYALIDFYMRINDFGYNAVVAHHAFYTVGNGFIRSEGFIRSDGIGSEDATLFAQRYAYYAALEEHFNRAEVHPCLSFIELLSGKAEKKSILFECFGMRPRHDGISVYQIPLFDAFNRLFQDKYDIYMYVNRDADAFHSLSERYDNILYPDTIGDRVFDLGFITSQIFSTHNMFKTGDRYLKIVQTVHDIIALRCHVHQKEQISYCNAMRIGFWLCDGIITISETCTRDLHAYFPNDAELRETPIRTILNANMYASEKARSEGNELPFSEYFLIFGNAFRHKAIKETVEVVAKTRHNYIVVGYGDNEYIEGNIYGYRSGYLDGAFIAYLYANCKAVIFPSLYEGFGVPVTKALVSDKRVVLYNNEMNRELHSQFAESKEHFLFFDRFEEIGEIVDSVDFSAVPKPAKYEDTPDRLAMETEAFFAEILDAEIDVDRLNTRRHIYNAVALAGDRENLHIAEIDRLHREFAAIHTKFSEHRQRPHLIAPLKEHLNKRHPKVFAFLKRVRDQFRKG